MFTKLLKYEFKSNSALFGILSLCSVVASALGSVLLSLFINMIEQNSDSTAAVLGGMICVMLWGAVFLALIAYSIAISFLLLYRFYKHLFSDEGYLTFTLPVTTHQILLSSIVHIAVWSIAAIIITLFDIGLLFLPIFREADSTIWAELRNIFGMVADEMGAGYQIARIFASVGSAIYGLIMPLLSITIGSLIAKKHKILASFGIYFGLTTLLSTLSGTLSMFTLISEATYSTQNMQLYMTLSTALPGLLYLGLGIGGYFLMHYLLNRKLNLT